ncbi:MAG: ATP-binding protein [Acidobacteria bacterium]|nr:ATP-binding protein [Acidobacteriota bacterium]
MVSTMLERALRLSGPLSHYSLFLFGPRQTGKTTYLRQELPHAVFYNLLETNVFRELSNRPELIRQRLTGREEVIVIDEIQRLPELLYEVQAMIDRNRALRFVMTGSSARSMRTKGINLLGGRAGIMHFHPLISAELGGARVLERCRYGSLPSVLLARSPGKALESYVSTYLAEEIRAEGFVRSMQTFSRFLDVAAAANGQIINFTEAGSDAQVPSRTVREHYQLLEDTLIGSTLPPFQKFTKRKPVATSKFYFFDMGVANHLRKRPRIEAGSTEFGEAFEHLIWQELRAWLSYNESDEPLTFWRTHSGAEVDFVLGDHTAIEVKAAENVTERHLKHLRTFREETTLKRLIVVSQETVPRRTDDGIEILPVEYFLRELWASGRKTAQASGPPLPASMPI